MKGPIRKSLKQSRTNYKNNTMKRKYFYRAILLFVILTQITISGQAQTEFIEEYLFQGLYTSGESNTSNQKLIDQRQNGFVIGMKDYTEKSPMIATIDEAGAYTGLFKRYLMDEVTCIHLLALKSGMADDGFFLTGQTDNDHNYLLRLDNSGTVMWARQMEVRDDNAVFRAVSTTIAIQINDGNILIAGSFKNDFGSPDPQELFLMKINASTGAVFWSYQYTSSIMGNGFQVRDIIETTPGEYYITGGGSSYPNFIAHFSDAGTLLTSDLWRYNFGNSYLNAITSDEGGIIAVGDRSGKLTAFRVNADLTTPRTLDNISGKYDRYDFSGSYVNSFDVLSHNGKIAITGVGANTATGKFLSLLSNGGDVLNSKEYFDNTTDDMSYNLFDTDDSFFAGDMHSTGISSVKFDFRLTAFSLAGNTCDQDNISINRVQPNFTATQGTLIETTRAFHYELLNVTPENYSIPTSSICEDCFLSSDDVDPITTSTGGTDLCGFTSMELFAPTGFVSWQWYLDGSLVGTTSSITITEGGLYTVILTNAEGCEVELSILITPGVDVSSIDGNIYCFSFSYPLPDLGDGGSWSGTAVIEAGGNYYFSPPSPGSYVLTYCNSDGCCEDAHVTVESVDITILDLEGDCESGCTGSITATVDGDSYDWELLEGVTTVGTDFNEVTVTFSGLCAGTYTLKATGVEEPKCTGHITFEVTEGGWHKTTENTTGTENAGDVVTDANGNVYITGTFTETTELEGGANPNITIGPASSFYGAMFVAKYDDCGTLLWVAHSSGAPLCSGNSLVLDENNGMVYVTGNLIQTALFNSAQSADGLCTSGHTQYLTATSNRSGYVAQYDMNTGCLYFAAAFSDGEENDVLTITADQSAKSIYVGGSYKTLSTDMNVRSFIHKFSPDVATGALGILNTLGAPVWSALDLTSPANAFNQVNDLDYDENRDLLYAIGTYRYNLQLMGSSLTHASMGSDAFLATIEDLGLSASMYDLRGGNGSNNETMTGNGVSVHESSGVIFLTGTHLDANAQPFFFTGINPLLNFAIASNHSYMIGARIGGTFTPWSRQTIPTPSLTGWIEGKDVSNVNGNAYFVNEFSGAGLTVATGGGPGMSMAFVGTLAGNSHIGIISYSMTGTRNWMNVTESPFASSSDDHNAYSITSNQNGKSFIAGSYNNKLSYNYGVPYSGDLNYSGLIGGYNACVLRVENNDGALKTVQSNLGSDDILTDDIGIAIYPNPASDILTFDLNDQAEQVVYNIYSINGVLLATGVITDRKYQLNVSDFATGIYMVEFQTKKGNLIKKVILE